MAKIPQHHTRRAALLAAMALSSAPLWAWAQGSGGAAEALEAKASIGAVELWAKGERGALTAGLWAKSDDKAPLVELHARVAGLDAQGREAFFMRAQWIGKGEPGVGKMLFGARVWAPGSSPEPVASLRVEPRFARFADGRVVGSPAPWSLSAEQSRALGAELDAGVARDRKRSEAFQAQKGGKADDIAAAAALWAKPGENPYDPSSLLVGLAWANGSPKTAEILGSKATFFSAQGLSPFLVVEARAPRAIAPGDSSRAWIGVGLPQSTPAQRQAFEAAAKSHGVNVERVHAGPDGKASPQAERPGKRG